MFIQTEATPNPNTYKFIPECDVTGSANVVNITSRSEAHKSALAIELFRIEEVESVFLGKDFVTITKSQDSDWNILKPIILTTVMDFFTKGKKVLNDNVISSQKIEYEDEIVKQIVEIIEEKVRPAVANDGGDITFVSFENGIVKLEMHGSCSGCPSSTVTLKSGIENMLKHYVPEVIEVQSV